MDRFWETRGRGAHRAMQKEFGWQFKKTIEDSGSPLRQSLLRYMSRMVGHVVLDAESLSFVVGLLSLFGRESLLSLLHTGYDDEKSTKVVADKIEEIDRTDNNALAGFVLEAMAMEHCCLGGEMLRAQLKELLAQEEHDVAKRAKRHPMSARIRKLRHLFGLNDDDIELVCLALCYRQYSGLEAQFDRVPYPEKLELVALVAGMSATRVRQCSGRRARLVRCGLMEALNPLHPTCLYELCQEVYDYLLGLDCESLLERSHHRVIKAQYPADGFCLPQRSVEIALSLFRADRPCNLVLYGEPGTGKTEFAKAIAVQCGKPACFVAQGEEGDTKFRRLALQATVNTALAGTGVVVVDEADDLLNTGYDLLGGNGRSSLRKGWLNDFLDQSKAQVVWIVNDIHCIEESTRRRFAFSIEFKHCTARRREQIWREHLKGHPLRDRLGEPVIAELAREFHVNAGGIASALARLSQLAVSCDYFQT